MHPITVDIHSPIINVSHIIHSKSIKWSITFAKQYATGSIKIICLQIEMIKDSIPFPKA